MIFANSTVLPALRSEVKNWQSFGSGMPSFKYAFAFATGGRCRVEVYIDLGDRSRNLTAFQALRTDDLALGKALREPLKWEILDGKRHAALLCTA
jgi:hypothetical protein